jgi:hypothetical protein
MSTPASQPKSSAQAATAAASSTASASATASTAAMVCPSPQTMWHAAKIAIEQDRAIMLDYYQQTANGTAYLGEDGETKERILIKSKEEFTSLIGRTLKADNDFIVLTENSLYIVSGKIQKRIVNLAVLHAENDI